MTYKTKEERNRYRREWYIKNRTRALKIAREWMDNNKERMKKQYSARYSIRKKILSELKAAPCMDCGNSFPPCAMDFDHRPGEIKISQISTLVLTGRIDAAHEEIKKCDLICANCHRIRTFINRRKVS